MMSAEFRTSVIYHCSACGQPIREVSGSGNNQGMKVWSDGKEECEMSFEQHWLVLCPHCQTPLWMDELEGYEEVDDGDEYDEVEPFPGLPDEGWPDLDLEDDSDDGASLNEPLEYEIPAFADYLSMLPTVKRFPEKLFELRLRAWWAGNDVRRGVANPPPLSEAEVHNLEALVGLLNAGSAYEQFLQAEALRELGRFDEAAAVLAAINEPDMARAIGLLQQRIAARDAVVVQVVG